MRTQRLGHATLETPDLERQVDHYTRVMGLIVVERNPDRAVLTTTEGVECVVLSRGKAPALAGLAFQLSPGAALDEAAAELGAAGISADFVADPTPGVARALRFRDIAGTTIDIYGEYRFQRPAKQLNGGVLPLKLGHVARFVTDVKATAQFYGDRMGFRVSDWRADVGVFMRCGPDHHTINAFAGKRNELAHIAFEVKDAAEINRACDILARNGSRLDWGPSRHNIGHNIACYHHDPDGNRIEIYTEMDQMKSEELGYFEPRPWHEDLPQRPKIWPNDTSKNYWGAY
jgi:catechol 2,3-dioxygenase-like lactoylglutathione lyase family enzyme